MRVGFRPGAWTWRGLAFDLLWLVLVPRSSRVTYWIGTDVHSARAGRASRFPLWGLWLQRVAGRSAAGAPWLAEELADCGVPAEYLRFPSNERPANVPWPRSFAVSTYISAVKPEFYGASTFLSAVEALPEVEFYAYGAELDAPFPNIHQCGWTDDFRAALVRSVVHLRLTEHDAIAGTVREALSLGRYVLFGYDVPGVTVVDTHDAEEVIARIRELKLLHDSGSLALNLAGQQYIATHTGQADWCALDSWLLT